MRTPTLSRKPWIAVAAVVAAAAVIIAVAHQGMATASTGPPNAPANPLAHLIVPDGDDPRVRVSWDAPGTQVSGYTITRADGQQFTAVGNATTFSDHSVEPGTAYTYSVTASNARGASPSSASASASVPDSPSQPADLAASVADISATDEAASVTLTWAASTVLTAAQCETSYPLDGYTVIRSDGDDETELATPDSGATSFTDDTAAFGARYTYRVVARNAIGSSPAASASVNVPVPPVPPATGLTATITDPFDGSVSLQWNAPTNGQTVIGYMVLRYLGADPYQGTDIPTTLAEMATGTTLVDDTSEAGVSYSYIVMSRSADNISEPSNTAAIEAPAPPSGLTATASDGAIDLAWSAPAAGTVVSYRVQRQQSGDWANLTGTSLTSHSDDTAQAGVEYTYRAQHRNRYGGSTWTESDPVALVVAPGKPTDLAATVDGGDNLLSWTAPDDSAIDGYRVRHHIGDAEPTTLAEDISDTSYRHSDAAADVTHHYAVQAYNSAGNGPWSDTASTVRITPPGVPQNVAVSLEGNDIVVTWERPDTVHISGYTVRHQTGDADPMESDRMPEGTTTYRLDDVTGDVQYRIAVRAHNDASDSPWSDDQEIMYRLPPSVPTNVTVTVGETDIVLSWGAPATGTPDGYRVEYGEPDDDQPHTASLPADQTSYAHSDNVEGVTYQYRVQAHNSAGDSRWSDTMTAKRTLAPQPPTDLAASASGSAITLSWQAPTTGIVATYEIRYAMSGSDTTTTASVDADETTYLHLGADGDTEYSYQVRSVNPAGNSAWAGPVAAMWVIPPTPPTNVAAAIDGGDILVTWTRPDSAFIDEYRLQFKAQDSESWNPVTVGADQNSHRHVGPTPGARYEYRVKAVNAGGQSEWSNVASAVWYTVAAPPTHLTFTPFGNNLLLQWNPSPTPGVTGYQIRQRIDDGQWTIIEPAGSIHLAAWSSDQSHHDYRIRSLVEDKHGDWSLVQRAHITTPTAVTSLTGNREGAHSFRLHWEEPASGTPHRYIIEGRWKDDADFKHVSTTAGRVTTTRIDMGPDSEYTYRVRAQNQVGIRGPYEDDVTTHIVMPPAGARWEHVPSAVDARMLDPGTVKLTWQAPGENGDGVSNYRIYRKPTGDTRRLGDSYRDHVLVAYSSGNVTTFIDHTVEVGVTYEYAVAAYRDAHAHPLGPISHRAYARPWE